MVLLQKCPIYFGLLLATAGGAAASNTQSSPCYFSSLRINLESSQSLFEASMEWAKEWKGDCDCLFRANGFRLLTLQSSRIAGGISNLPFTGPPSKVPVVKTPACDWNSIRAAYVRGMAATSRARKLLDTIQCFEERAALNTTILRQNYNNALAEYAAVSSAINTALETCADSPCDRPLNRQILNSCPPASCRKCQVVSHFTGLLRETTIRAQEAFFFASPGAGTCCLEKAAFATNVYRLMSFVYMSYKSIAQSVLPPTKTSDKELVAFALPTCCDQKAYACTLYSKWGFCNITFEEFYTALNLMDFAGESITCCPESSQEALTEVTSQLSRLQVAAEKYGLYLSTLNSICLDA